MKKIEKLNKKLNSIMSKIKEVTIERRDTSYRRDKGYFGTNHAYTDDVIIYQTIRRTNYLNTYLCVSVANKHLATELISLKIEFEKEQKRLQKIALNNWVKESIEYCKIFTEQQINDGTINTNYVKIFIVGDKHIYGCHPQYQHEDYNKFKAMPNTKKHRAIAEALNSRMIEAGLTI